MTPYEAAREKLYKLGIKLEKLPGEYRVNFLKGGIETQRVEETLQAAIERGIAIASQGHPSQLPPLGPMGPRKGRKGVMWKHNRKLAERRRMALSQKEKTS